MSDEKKAGELSEANEALRHSRASLTQGSSLLLVAAAWRIWRFDFLVFR
jgi:hypothetical protein